ncbi:hypothetical protein AUN10_17770 [Cronobacter sakazakii]|nr:hypothetical protein AUN10_17770 [Cronobacter sakazakii]
MAGSEPLKITTPSRPFSQPAHGPGRDGFSIRGQFGYRKLLYVKLIFYHFWFFWKRNILDVKTVMRGH